MARRMPLTSLTVLFVSISEIERESCSMKEEDRIVLSVNCQSVIGSLHIV